MELGIIEVVVNRRKNILLLLAAVLLVIVTVLLAGGGLLLLASLGLWALIPVALGVAAGVGAYFSWMNVNVDYEYSLVDRELRVAKIMNKEKRKSLAVYDLDKMEIIAPMRSHHLDGLTNRRDTTSMDYSTHDSSRTDTTYYCYLEGNKRLILDLGGDDGKKLINAIRTFAPRKIFTD